jgi:hypothetical protein
MLSATSPSSLHRRSVCTHHATAIPSAMLVHSLRRRRLQLALTKLLLIHPVYVIWQLEVLKIRCMSALFWWPSIGRRLANWGCPVEHLVFRRPLGSIEPIIGSLQPHAHRRGG